MDFNISQEIKYNYFNKNFSQIEKWIDNNIYTRANQVVNKLFEKKIITFDDIINLYPQITESDYENDEEYYNDLDNNSQQDIYEWYIISESAYNKFKYWGYPVLQFEELFFWGRTSFGQSIVIDFYYDIDKIKEIIPEPLLLLV